MIQYIGLSVKLHGASKGINHTPEEVQRIIKRLLYDKFDVDFDNDIEVDIEEFSLRSEKNAK